MAESIFARVRRIVSASVEDGADALERVGGESVMRETIREVDRAIDDVKRELGDARGRRLQAARQSKLLRERLADLDDKARFALAQGRDDLAEAAIARQVDFEGQLSRLGGADAQETEAEQRLEDCVQALNQRKRLMEDDLAAFAEARRDVKLSECGPSAGARATVERRVERAEQAFSRAMTAAGGTTAATMRADAAAAAKVAEIDGLKRSAAIAERLAALKAERMAS